MNTPGVLPSSTTSLAGSDRPQQPHCWWSEAWTVSEAVVTAVPSGAWSLQVAAHLVVLAGVGVTDGNRLVKLSDGAAQQSEIGDLGIKSGEPLL